MTEWGSSGTGNGSFNSPHGIAVNSSGFVYVADSNNNRTQVFTPSGTYVTKWGSSGTGNGQFNNPHAIAVDDNGLVYVADRYNNRIQVFTSTGVYLSQMGVIRELVMGSLMNLMASQ